MCNKGIDITSAVALPPLQRDVNVVALYSDNEDLLLERAITSFADAAPAAATPAPAAPAATPAKSDNTITYIAICVVGLLLAYCLCKPKKHKEYEYGPDEYGPEEDRMMMEPVPM